MLRLVTITGFWLVSGSLDAEPAAAKHWVSTVDAGRRIDGVWRSRGYGHVLVAKAGRLSRYHVAGRWCYRDPGVDGGIDESYRLVSIAKRGRIAFASAPGETRYQFDRIPRLPAACGRERAWTSAQIGQLVAATFHDLYPAFGRRGRTEQALDAAIATLPADVSATALYNRMIAALGVLDDAHVGLSATIDGEERTFESGEAPTLLAARTDAMLGPDPGSRERAWSRRYRDGIVATLDGGGHHVANRRILWGTIGRIGYINIVTMGNFAEGVAPDDTAALDAALDEVLTAFRGLPGVIVDVTNNRGGYDAIGLRIASRFAPRQELAFAKRGVGADTPFQPFHVEPSRRASYTGPVTLLTSDITVSAAETFTLAMRALPNVRHLGGTTRGAISDQLAKPLPNGWTLSLPAEIYRDAHAQSAEGIGIVPTTAIAPFMPSHAAVLRRITDEAATAAGGQPHGPYWVVSQDEQPLSWTRS